MTSEQPHWRGINHLALVTSDMDATVRFYHGVLGARLVATIGTEGFRHYFFEFGPEQTVAFFEYRGLEVDKIAKPAGVPDKRFFQFDHLSFNLPDEHALEELARRLKEHGCEVTDVVDHEHHAVDLLHRPERHRARGLVVGERRHRPGHRLRRRLALRRQGPGSRRPGADGKRPAVQPSDDPTRRRADPDPA